MAVKTTAAVPKEIHSIVLSLLFLGLCLSLKPAGVEFSFCRYWIVVHFWCVIGGKRVTFK
jgi:hypothetical protein